MKTSRIGLIGGIIIASAMAVVVALVVGFGAGVVTGINASPLGLPVKLIEGIKNMVPTCQPDSPGIIGSLTSRIPPLKWLNDAQRKNAQVILDVGAKLKASVHDQEVAIATAMQESGLMNLNYGDRDSLGLYQQRPSQGWGDPTQIMDPVYAATKFYKALGKVKDREGLSLMSAAMAVQRPSAAAYLATWAWDKKAISLVASVIIGKKSNPAPTATGTPTPSPAETGPLAPSAPTPSAAGQGNLLNCIGLSQLAPSSADKCDVGTDKGTAATFQGNTILLCEVQGITVNATVAKQVDGIVAAAAKDGIKLSGAGFRSYTKQVSLRTENGCANSYTATSSSCAIPTAIPGTSMHEQGLAVDWQMGPGDFSWLQKNAANFGFKNLPSEQWHWSVNGR